MITEDQVQQMSDSDLVSAVFDNVHSAAFHSRHSVYDDNCDILYREAMRRGNEELYSRGYRKAEKACGI